MTAPDHGGEESGQYPPGWVPDGTSTPQKESRSGVRTGLAALAVLAVVVAVVVGVVLSTSDDDSGVPASAETTTDAPATSSAPVAAASGAVASAGDVGPVAIITSDVTCQSWRAVYTTLTDAQTDGWERRDPATPATAWTPEQRAQFDRVGDALRSTADDAVDLARRTPYRAMRELYEAYIAYGRAYADSLADYQAQDDAFARANTAAAQAISEICAATDSGAALARATAVLPVGPPAAPAPPGDPAGAQPFIPEAGPTCARWVPAEAALTAEVQPWLNLDPAVPPDRWTPEQRAVADRTATVFTRSAATLEADGRRSGNAVFEDFATLAAQYLRAFAVAGPNYTAADRDLGMAGLRLDSLVSAACQADVQ